MVHLAALSSVPQIWFGDKHIGGASELQALLEGDNGAALLLEALSGPAPTLPQLTLPTTPSETNNAPRQPRQHEYFDVGRSTLSVWEIVSAIKAGLPITAHRHYGTIYKNCFTVRDFCDYFCSSYSIARQSAVELGQALTAAGVLTPATTVNDSALTFEGPEKLFQLHEHLHPHMLNTWYVTVPSTWLVLRNQHAWQGTWTSATATIASVNLNMPCNGVYMPYTNASQQAPVDGSW